ncbi:hypothetical protein [Candidatus Merdisoma sp. JLR.KK006]|uniref:hypothetical protein n=1 Tax=Candidatus Merdisoma sp. JLR.KK006 TaxID=3112626 RepID=UPI002FF315C1
MKIIRITTENEISVHDFPEGSHHVQNKVLRELIGPRCELYEHVMPNRLYKNLGASNKVGKEKGSYVSMLVDEEGLYHNLEINMAGSYLYETDKHGCAIVGNILIVGEVWERNGIDFCGISDAQFALLYPKLEELTKKARDVK